MFSHKYRYIFILLLSAYTYINTVLCEVYKYFRIETAWYVAFATITLVTLGTWEASRLMEPLFNKWLAAAKNKIKILLFFFGAGSVAATIITAVLVFAVSMLLYHHTLSASVTALKLNLIYAWLANLLFHLLSAVKFYFTEYKRKWVEAEELKRISAQAELQVIKSQINPHFLFNNLNVLSTLVMKDNDEANKFIEEFSKVYRYILSNHEKELVDLKTELDFIEPYIFLLQKRFGDGLTVQLNVPESYRHFYIIPASLQMLIENATKHNIISRTKPLHIDVHVNGNNTIVVTNNLQPRDNAVPSTKIGLTNIKKRYMLVSGREVSVSSSTGSFSVTIPLLQLN